MSNWDDELEILLANDEKRYQDLVTELRGELGILDSLEESVKKEIGKTRKKLMALITKMERSVGYSHRHFATLRQRNKVWRNRLGREPEPESESEDPAFVTVDTIMKLILGVSMRGEARANDFEALSFSFIIPSVLKRALERDCEGYLLRRQPDLTPLQKEGEELLKSLRDSYSDSLYSSQEIWDSSLPLVKDWLSDSALPKMFNGRDDRWDEDECYPYQYMVKWIQDPFVDPTYYDCMEVIRCRKH